MSSSIKNIAIVINSLRKGGAEIQAVELAKTLLTKYNVWLITLENGTAHPELLGRLDRYSVKLIQLYGSKIGCAIGLYKTIKENNIDCIYSYLSRSNFYAGIIGRLSRVKYIIGGIRNSLFPIKSVMYVERFIHNNFMTLSISNNYDALDNLTKNGFRKDKFRVIHNVFPAPLNDGRRIKQEISQIVSVGRFVEQKDYKTALSSIALLHSKHPDLKFKYLIIGYGELELQIREWIRSMRLEDIVEIKINPNNIYQNLLYSNIYLSTSLFEGVSNSILEAMYAGLPIVATNAGDNKYMVYGNNGYLTKIKDIENISNNLYLLLSNQKLAEEMGVESKMIVQSKFSQETFARNNFDLLEELMCNELQK